MLFQKLMQEIKTKDSSQGDTEQIESMIKYLVIRSAEDNTPSVSNLSPERQRFLEKKFLRQLKYDDMGLRQDTIEEAHKKTFRWIFDKPEEQRGQWDNFQEWVTSSQQLYWITGKPGSGKSTLMKLICDAVTKADPDGPQFDLDFDTPDVTVATFFFWAASGAELQTSREGLFRALIHQLLQQHPSLIPLTTPDRWEAICLFDDETPFTEPELRKLLRKCLVELSHKSVYLFIDGLDEFAGRHDDLLQFFFEIMATCSVKMCISSRPWEIFQESFSNKPSLRIHDLTYHDMEAFLASNMRLSPSFVTLEQEQPRYTQVLLDQVLEKAQGVFLWVKVVTHCLIEALRAGATIEELEKLLDHLPDKRLDDFFHHILETLEPGDLDKASHYIGFMRAHEALNEHSSHFAHAYAINLSFADELDPDTTIRLPVRPLEESNAVNRIGRIRKRINTSCRGLLEVSHVRILPKYRYSPGAFSHWVQYSHRSVRDYLETPRARAILSERIPNAHLKLCSASLACLKICFDPDQPSYFEGLYSQIAIGLCKHAALVPTEYSNSMVRIMDELLRFWSFASVDQLTKVITNLLLLEDSLMSVTNVMRGWRIDGDPRPQFMVLSLAVAFNIVEYVKNKVIHADGYTHGTRLSLLEKFTRTSYRSKAPLPSELDLLLQVATALWTPSPDMVDLLLRSGSNLHSVVWSGERDNISRDRKYSIWEGVLAWLICWFSHEAQSANQEDILTKRQTAWRQVGRLMSAYGARVGDKSVKNALEKLRLDGWSCELEARDGILSKVLKKALRDLVSEKVLDPTMLPRWQAVEREAN